MKKLAALCLFLLPLGAIAFADERPVERFESHNLEERLRQIQYHDPSHRIHSESSQSCRCCKECTCVNCQCGKTGKRCCKECRCGQKSSCNTYCDEEEENCYYNPYHICWHYWPRFTPERWYYLTQHTHHYIKHNRGYMRH